MLTASNNDNTSVFVYKAVAGGGVLGVLVKYLRNNKFNQLSCRI